MSIEKPKASPQTESDAPYERAAEASKKISTENREPLSLEERRKGIGVLFSSIQNLDTNDADSVRKIAARIARFIQSDPLSDQQAGIIARSLEKLWDLAYQENKKDLYSVLSDEEIQEILIGDWDAITKTFSGSKEKSRIWKESIKEVSEGKKETTVYRAMRISEEELENIRRFGIVASGLSKYKDLESLIKEQLSYFGGNNKSISYLMRRIHFSKVTALIGTWSASEFLEPFRLGISATTGENLKKKKSFFGSTIIEIKIPQNTIVNGKAAEDGSWTSGEDEKTILYYVDPKNIAGIYKTIDNGKNLWQQIEEQKNNQ